MDVATIVGIVGVGVGAAGSVAAVMAQRHSKETNRIAAESAKEAKQKEQAAIVAEIRELRTKVESFPEHMTLVAKSTMSDMLEPFRKMVYELQTSNGLLDSKLELAFKSLEGLADDVAQYVMHHPDETRARFDELLDHYKARTLTADEDLELRRYLDALMKWNPGDDIGFNVYPGEQFGAAIMLHTMDLFRMRRELEKRNE